MHSHSLERHTHPHRYLGAAHDSNQRRTLAVVALTAAMMVAEIAAGIAFGSMALLADGWHLASHAGALGISAAAYAYARRHQDSGRYAFGAAKAGDLAGFASALVLLMVAVLMAWESAQRLMVPAVIAFDEAILVAILGLVVNLVSAWMLRDEHHHDHDHDHDHADDHHADHNLRAAYLHVLADALTSVLAIAALVSGRFLGWTWMDPVMGIVGAVVITKWSVGLLRSTSAVLLDATPQESVAAAVRAAIEGDGDNRVADLHLWRLGPGHLAAVITVVTHHPRAPEHYKSLLAGIGELSHVTVEVQECADHRDAA
jgi:cation diffusion facilitator family transporter